MVLETCSLKVIQIIQILMLSGSLLSYYLAFPNVGTTLAFLSLMVTHCSREREPLKLKLHWTSVTKAFYTKYVYKSSTRSIIVEHYKPLRLFKLSTSFSKYYKKVKYTWHANDTADWFFFNLVLCDWSRFGNEHLRNLLRFHYAFSGISYFQRK